jgi:hypothetical protein
MPPLTQAPDAAGASFIAPPQLLASGDFAEITRRATQAAALVRGS